MMNQDALMGDFEETLEDLWQVLLSNESDELAPPTLTPLLEEARTLGQRLFWEQGSREMFAELETELHARGVVFSSE